MRGSNEDNIYVCIGAIVTYVVEPTETTRSEENTDTCVRSLQETSTMSHNNKPPAPDQKLIPWNVYHSLHSKLGPSSEAKIPCAVVKKVKQVRSSAELTQYEFTNEEDALTAFIRAVALLNLPPATPSVLRSKTYLLFARSTVWLASKAHAENASKPPTSAVKEQLQNNMSSEDVSLSKMVDSCIQIASCERDSKSFALTLLARVMVGLVASDYGPHARPAMAEA